MNLLTSSPPHHQRVGLRGPARCRSWSPIKKTEAQLAWKRSVLSPRKTTTPPHRQRDNQPRAARGEAAVTRRAELRPVLHTDERFRRHQTWGGGGAADLSTTCPAPPCLLLSASI